MKKKEVLVVHLFFLFCIINPIMSYSSKPKGIILVGIGMKDMGLGKIAEYFSYSIKHVARSQGSTGGHRVIKRTGHEFKLSMIPSGIMRKDTVCYLTAGMEIEPDLFLEEIAYLQEKNVSTHNRIWISPKAHVVFPYHKTLDDCMSNITQSGIDIGSRKGTGSAAACKRLRIGIRIADLLDPERFRIALQENLTFINNMLVKLFGEKPYDFDTLYKQYREYAKKLKPYIKDDLEIFLNKKLVSGEAVLFEGAQGSSADISFGAYPYVSSSSTSVAGICTGAGVGPNKISHVIGVVPTYITALGGAPLPTEIKDLSETPSDVLQKIESFPQEKSASLKKKYTDIIKNSKSTSVKATIEMLKAFFKEIGLTKDHALFDEKTLQQYIEDTLNTEKIEKVHTETNQSFPDTIRYGWIDLVMIREAILLNGIDSLVLTKLDTLDDFDEIKICIDYKIGNKSYDYMPSAVQDSKSIEPIYITIKGWKKPTSHIKKFSQLPEEARDFIKKIELVAHTTISHISTGPERDQMIICEPLIL